MCPPEFQPDLRMLEEECPREFSGEEVLENVLILMQDYKFLHVAVMICVTLVNTHTHTDRQLLTSYFIHQMRTDTADNAELTIVLNIFGRLSERH